MIAGRLTGAATTLSSSRRPGRCQRHPGGEREGQEVLALQGEQVGQVRHRRQHAGGVASQTGEREQRPVVRLDTLIRAGRLSVMHIPQSRDPADAARALRPDS